MVANASKAKDLSLRVIVRPAGEAFTVIVKLMNVNRHRVRTVRFV